MDKGGGWATGGWLRASVPKPARPAIDAGSYIRDTIDAIGAIGKCPVLAQALSDQSKIMDPQAGGNRIRDTDLPRTLRNLENQFSITAVSIASVPGIRRLAERIIDQFSRDARVSDHLRMKEEHWDRKRA